MCDDRILSSIIYLQVFLVFCEIFMNTIVKKTAQIGGKTLSLEVGRLAQQASGAVLARYGDTMVLATVVVSSKESTLDYFPLSVEYVERLYAGGRIKGSRWVKREGRPSDDAILAGRIIDRSIRPLFPKSFKRDVQVIVTVLSVDGENDPDILGLVATSAAIAISPIPWNGPIGAVRMGYIQGKDDEPDSYLINPTIAEQQFSEFDFVVSSSREKVVMLEGGFCETPEPVVYSAILAAKEENNKIIALISELVETVGKTKLPVLEEVSLDELMKKIAIDYSKEMEDVFVKNAQKESGGGDDLAQLAKAIAEAYENKWSVKDIETALDKLFKKKVRKDVIEKKKRVDGRKTDEIRPIEVEVGILPRTHGSAMFKRGQTQALTVATLGAPSLEQLIESPAGEESKRYMHHYSMPPYSVGETGRIGVPSRREIGHGALAERALLAVIPSLEEFPYTLRLVSEIMSSNGSTSMASTCGSTLALMDAGVPIKEPVAGISIGLVTEGEQFELLTDIVGVEDFCGDMDFKVAGTKYGITAIQLDIKIDGLTDEIVEKTLSRAKEARMAILEKMLAVLPQPRKKLSHYAPKVQMVKIPAEKIGEIIGPGGRMIRNIQGSTGATLDVEDDGSVTVSGADQESVQKAVSWIEGLTREVKEGEEFEGEVKRMLPFGAFVEILPGKEGMVHVSQMSTGYVNTPEDVVRIGQKVKVRVIKVDEQHRIDLSMLFGEDAQKTSPRERRFGNGGGGAGGGSRRGGFGGSRRRF
jgi:polyribonucleotide nucleotidyltransferase